MNRLKALYRSWATPCAGEKFYSPRHRGAWLEQLSEAGVRGRAELLDQQLDICCRYAEKHGGSCYGKAGSIQPMSFSGRFPAWGRSEWPF